MPDLVTLGSPDWCKYLCNGLEMLRKSSTLCDTVIYSNNGETLNAQAGVLMAASPHIKSLFSDSKKKQFYSVEIKSISTAIWEAILNFIYRGEINIERGLLEKLLEAAEKLEIDKLSQQCYQQLNNQPLAPGTRLLLAGDEEGDDDDNDDTDNDDETIDNGEIGIVHNLSVKKEEDPETATDLSIRPTFRNSTQMTDQTTPQKVPQALLQVSRGMPMPGPMSGPMPVMSMPGNMHIGGGLWMSPQMPSHIQWPFFPPNMPNLPGQQQQQQQHMMHFLPPSPRSNQQQLFTNAGPPPPLQPATMSPSGSGGSNSHSPASPDGGEDLSKRHKCPDCGKRFKLRHVLEQHKLTHTNIKPYFCDICGFRARQKAVIWKHKKLKHGKEENVPIRVDRDDGTADLSNIDELIRARGQIPGSPMNLMRGDIDQVTPPPITIVPTLDLAKVTPPSVTPPHLSSIPASPAGSQSGGKRDFICKTCNKPFRNKHVLAQHDLIHSKFRKYKCDICPFRAKQKAVIWRHIKVKHAGQEVTYTTETPPTSPGGTPLEMESDDEDSLQQTPTKQEDDEESTIESPSPHPPSQEKRTFGMKVLDKLKNSISDKLKNSISTRKSRSYDIQKMMLSSGSSLHPPSLVGFQQHGSPVTLTSFSSDYGMSRKFQCKICNKVFKNKHILIQHELVHSTKRRYACQFCEFRAKQKAVMWRHLRSRHPNEEKKDIIEDKELKEIKESAEARIDQVRSDLTEDFSRAQMEEEMRDVKADQSAQGNVTILNGLAIVHDKDEDCDDLEEEALDEPDSDEDDLHEGDAHFCQTCGKGFQDKDYLERHQLRHVKPMSCDKCDYKTRVEENLEHHNLIKHTIKPEQERKSPEIQSPVNSNFIVNPALNLSKVQEPTLASNPFPTIDIRPSGRHKLFSCNMCSFSTRHQTSLSRHKRLKHDNESQGVEAAGQAMLVIEEEENHVLKVPTQMTQRSEPASPAIPPANLMSFCLQQNPASFNLFSNQPPPMPIQMHLQQQQQQLQQQLQHQQQEQQQQLNGLAGDSEAGKRYRCHVCGRGFKHRHVLSQHALVHTDLKPYKCDQCDFRGRQKASLWRHKQKHAANGGGNPRSSIPPALMSLDGTHSNNSPASMSPQVFAQGENSHGAVFPGEQTDDEEEPDDFLLLAENYVEDGEEEDPGEDMDMYAEEVATESNGQEAYEIPSVDGQYACSLCQRILPSKAACRRHCLTHRTGKCYTCPKCYYQTPHGYSLYRHMQTHNTDKEEQGNGERGKEEQENEEKGSDELECREDLSSEEPANSSL